LLFSNVKTELLFFLILTLFPHSVSHFGNDILTQDGTIDRKKLGTIVFNDEKKRWKEYDSFLRILTPF